MNHHQKKLFIKTRRVGAIVVACLVIHQLDLHNSQGDDQKLSSTTFMSTPIDNRDLFHGDRAEVPDASSWRAKAPAAPASPAIVQSHIPTHNVISATATKTTKISSAAATTTSTTRRPESVGVSAPRQAESLETTTMVVAGDNTSENVSAPQRSDKKRPAPSAPLTMGASESSASKLNRVERDQAERPVGQAAEKLPHLVLVTNAANEIHSDQIYIAETSSGGEAGIIQWLEKKKRQKKLLLLASGQAALNELSISELKNRGGAKQKAATGAASASAAAAAAAAAPAAAAVSPPQGQVSTVAPVESGGADELSVVLMEDRLVADKLALGDRSAAVKSQTADANGGKTIGASPTITSVLSSRSTLQTSPMPLEEHVAGTPMVVGHRGTSGDGPACSTGQESAACFSQFLFGWAPETLVAQDSGLEHLINLTKRTSEQKQRHRQQQKQQQQQQHQQQQHLQKPQQEGQQQQLTKQQQEGNRDAQSSGSSINMMSFMHFG